MTEKNIIKAVEKNTGYDHETVEKIFTNIFKVIGDSIMKEKNVQIKDFGSFHLKHLHRRVIGTHYMTGEEAESPEHYKINFMAYADLKRRAQRKLMRQLKKMAEQEKMEYEEETQ